MRIFFFFYLVLSYAKIKVNYFVIVLCRCTGKLCRFRFFLELVFVPSQSEFKKMRLILAIGLQVPRLFLEKSLESENCLHVCVSVRTDVCVHYQCTQNQSLFVPVSCQCNNNGYVLTLLCEWLLPLPTYPIFVRCCFSFVVCCCFLFPLPYAPRAGHCACCMFLAGTLTADRCVYLFLASARRAAGLAPRRAR